MIGYGYSRFGRRLLEKFQRQLWIWPEVYYRLAVARFDFGFSDEECGKHLVGLYLLKTVLEPTN